MTGVFAGCLEGGGTASDSSQDRTGDDSETGDGDTDPDRNETGGEPDDGTGGETGTEPTVVERFDCGSAHRPSCDVDAGEYVFETGDTAYETVGTAAYPDPPDEVTESTATTFAKDHERAYQQNAAVCPENESITDYNATVPTIETFDWYDEKVVVRLELMISDRRRSPGASDVDIVDTPSAAVYAIDETGAARVETKRYQEPEDPIESGELVVCF
ncbi:hypothetical protein EA473_19010 [Natrarchaeobius chitinivorans]|uniref:Uncharacterized protein n=1 Tax=Natrarchaeobius chitinivorans TaxID=1679083 RepID=A0A3N6LRK0_NATCH|nr:hypothetical protein EA473_19010 [Natrarchaeobius chitinivorans]